MSSRLSSIKKYLPCTIALALVLAPAVLPAPSNAASQVATNHQPTPAQLTATTDNSNNAPKSLANEQLVVAQLEPSGLQQKSELINRIVATGYDQQTIAVETSTNRLRYLDQTGAPALDGQTVLYPVGGQPQTTTTTIADFAKPLPIALQAEYATPQGGQKGVNAAEIPGKAGDLNITYTVTNTAVQRQNVSYQDAKGVTRTKELPVFAPFVGVLQATVPTNIKITNPGDAVVGTATTGETTLTWNLVLYPPVGSYQQRLSFGISSSELAIPGVTMQAMPITNSQSPAIKFNSKLLSQSVDGNQDLLAGLDQLNSGTLKLANAAGKLASGNSSVAAGIGKSRTGVSALTTGATSLTNGLDQLTQGLEQLAGTEGLPAAAAGSAEIATVVKKIAARVGGPWDPPLPNPAPDPLPKDATLYQILELLNRGAAPVAIAASDVSTAITSVLGSLASISADSGAAQTKASDAKDSLDSLISELCDLDPGPDPISADQCTELKDARDDTAAAATKAGAALSTATTATGSLAIAKVKASLVAVATTLNVHILPVLLRQVSALSLSLDSRNTGDPAVYQSLMALNGALVKASGAASQFATGAGEATTGSQALATGTNSLNDGLLKLLTGANTLTAGSNQLTDGISKLSADGTEKMITEITDASKKTGLADAYLLAASDRATDSAPYPTPEGATSTVAYVYSLAPVTQEQTSPAVAVGILGLIAAGGVILIIRRIRTAPEA